MRIAVVFPEPYDPARTSLDLELLCGGFAELGHETELIAVRAEDAEYALATELVDSPDRLAHAEFWQSRRIDLAIVITWMSRASILTALKRAGSIVVSKTDTDGLLGVRVNPRASFQRMVYSQRTPIARVGAAWFWLKKLAWQHEIEDQEYVASSRAADLIWVESESAGDELARFMDQCGTPNLRSKIIAIPNAVGKSFIEPPIPMIKDLDVVAVGRWDDPQKNAPLIRDSLQFLLQSRPDCRIALVGRGSDKAFASVSRRHRRFTIHGQVPRSKVAEILLRSKVILFASRWEGGRPNAANEALACGCTVVGPPIPAFRDLVEGGFGRLPRRSDPRSLAAAIEAELDAWASGARIASKIADHWRSRLTPVAVCRELLERVMRQTGVKVPEPVRGLM